MSDNAKVCSNHFRLSDFITTLTGKRVLSKDAVPFEPVKSSALVAKKTRKPPKDRTPVITDQINGIKSFLNYCFSYSNRPPMSLPLSIKKAIAVHTASYHSFFVKMLHCYYLPLLTYLLTYLLPSGADPVCLIFLIQLLSKLQCVHSKH